jgi:histidyl-tRNA synthetase
VTDRLGAQGTVLGGGRYDGLMESLGGAPTPAVGWAAGIERLAMLVADAGTIAEDRTEVTVVVEDDRALATGMGHAAALRRGGLSAELIASGSPRKRFDKAVKSNTRAILALGWGDEGVTTRLRNVDGDVARIEALIA